MKFVKSINETLYSLLGENNNIVLIGEDLSDPYGGAFKVTKGLSTEFPDRVLSTPISEAAIVGMAGGMAIGGLMPIVEIMFGDFIMLASDQLLNHLVKYEWMYNQKVKVPVTIRATMGGRRGYGPTHSQSLEPILASIPGLKIFSPSHYHDPGDLLKSVVLTESSTKIFCEYKINYARELINKKNCKEGLSVEYSNNKFPTAYLSNSDFEDPELLIISHGGNAILIEDLLLDLLFEYELPVQANFPSQIKPIMVDDLFEGYRSAKAILIFEESPKNFGWGNEIVSNMVDLGFAESRKVIRIGAEETPIPSSLHLENKVLPSIDSIYKKLKSNNII